MTTPTEDTTPFVRLAMVEDVLNLGRANSLWPITFGLACCAVEMVATGMAKFDLDRGIFTGGQCRSFGVTGANLRAAGVPYDVRKVEPYGAYPRCQFDIPTRTESDSFACYWVRVREMKQSVRIIEQALERLPGGPVIGERGLGSKKRLKPPVGTRYYAMAR